MVYGKYLDKSIRLVKFKWGFLFLDRRFSFSDGTNAFSDIAFILAIVFVAIANVLLLNVLVALFKYEEK